MLGWMVLTIYSWVMGNDDFNVISVLPQASLCSLSVRHLYSVITQRTGTEENLQLCLQTLLQLEGEREQLLSWRLAPLTRLTLDREQVGSLLCHSTFRGFGTCHAPPKPAGPAAHLWRVPSMSQACRNTHNCTGRLEKLSAHIHHYFRTQSHRHKVPGRWRNTTLHPKFKWSIMT